MLCLDNEVEEWNAFSSFLRRAVQTEVMNALFSLHPSFTYARADFPASERAFTKKGVNAENRNVPTHFAALSENASEDIALCCRGRPVLF